MGLNIMADVLALVLAKDAPVYFTRYEALFDERTRSF